jgi:hypothetical protein
MSKLNPKAQMQELKNVQHKIIQLIKNQSNKTDKCKNKNKNL